MTDWKWIKEAAGVILKDTPRLGSALYAPWRGADAWTRLCNRTERLASLPSQRGYHCPWEHGSGLHATEMFPFLGRRLLRVALAEWPLEFAERPRSTSGSKVSFIFAHGGRDRLPQLQRTLMSVFAQRDVQVECLVVDQSAEPIQRDLPEGVRYHYLDKTGLRAGWYKSWAYNVGARLATGELLIFHDGDICAPARYAAEVVRCLQESRYRAASLQRFLFYLDEPTALTVQQQGRLPAQPRIMRIWQNWKGGTIAVERDAFFELGGFDEGFVDWGGEDDEFYDRCQMVGHCRYGFIPFVHLWHQPQSDRHGIANPNTVTVLPWRLSLTAADRSFELTRRCFGTSSIPDPSESYRNLLTNIDQPVTPFTSK